MKLKEGENVKMKRGSTDRSGSHRRDREKWTGAIISPLIHRIPSGLHSEPWMGESSNKMGDLLGSSRVVTPLFAIVSPGNVIDTLTEITSFILHA